MNNFHFVDRSNCFILKYHKLKFYFCNDCYENKFLKDKTLNKYNNWIINTNIDELRKCDLIVFEKYVYSNEIGHSFNKSDYFLIQKYDNKNSSSFVMELTGVKDNICSFTVCKECWNNKLLTDDILSKYIHLFNNITEFNTSLIWKLKLIPKNDECQFDKFKEKIYNNL